MVSLEFRHIWVTEATSYFLGPRYLDLILSEILQKAVTEKSLSSISSGPQNTTVRATSLRQMLHITSYAVMVDMG